MEKKRESWANRTTFIFAAIGSAVGLGNAWRFPGLAAKHGGGAFLLVYFIAMFIIGWPLLMMEISMGRKMQQGAPGTLKGINKKAEFVGWAAVGNAFLIAAYYAVILAWIFVMIVKSFSIGGMSPTDAGNVFLDDVIQNMPIGGGHALDIPWAVLLALGAAWVVIYLCIRKGAHSAGKVVPYTVIIPIVLLVVLGANGIVKDATVGGGLGLKTFFLPLCKGLSDPTFWIDAYGHVFYCLWLLMAIMIAYGSFVNKKSDIIKDSLIISVADLLISILAGVVLFTTLSGTGKLEEYLANPAGSIGTAFIVYPQAMVMLSNIPWLNSMFSVLFFVTLFTLAIDSAFSIIEGISTAVSDKFHLTKRKTTLAVCVLCGVTSLLFATRSGMNWLDIVDNWANTVNLLLVGVIECMVVGWGFKTSKLRHELNRTATNIKLTRAYDWIIKVVDPLILAVLFLWNLVLLFSAGGYGKYPVWSQILGGWLPSALVFGGSVAIQIASQKSKKLQKYDASSLTWDESCVEELEEKENAGEISEEEAISATAHLVLDEKKKERILAGVSVDKTAQKDTPCDGQIPPTESKN
ncbi:MAG: sodium-dependent transporter [Clostridia bacterium]